MSHVGILELHQGRAALDALVASEASSADWNEADTRIQIIDRLLEDCLGWPKDWFRCEKHTTSGFADYVLGQPPILVVEAKRTGDYFEIPVTQPRQTVQSIKSLLMASEGLKSAMTQALNYCAGLGIEYAAVCNGHQLVVFIAIRHDKPPFEGKALVFDGWESFQSEFSLLWQNLSPGALRERRLTRTLTIEQEAAIPPKISRSVFEFHHHRYKTRLQSDLRLLGELLINDMPLSDDLKEQFYADCYCDTAQLSQYVMLSDRILKTRYAALFDPSEQKPEVVGVSSIRDLPTLEHGKGAVVDALTRRPIILLGDRGVGKSTFLENLVGVRARSTFRKTVYLNIDLGTQGALTTNIREFILSEIENQLAEKYDVDIYDKKFVRSIYDIEAKKFKKSIFAAASKARSEESPGGLNEYLASLARNKVEHLKRSVTHVAKGRKQQIVIIIDNADQRKTSDQQEAFLAAQEIASGWNSLVYVSLRPQTFHLSKQWGTLAAYANRVFTIAPPPPDEALVRRLTFALGIAEGRVQPETLERISLNLESITIVLRVLLRSIRSNPDIKKFLANITGGNIRALFEIITLFIGSPNVEFQKIIEIEQAQGNYVIPLHEFTKHALLGEYAHYSPTSSIALNIYDVSSNDPREHFLSPLILAYLRQPGPHRDADGFISARSIIEEMQKSKFLPAQIHSHINVLLQKNLIESVGRIVLDLESHNFGEQEVLSGGYRITSVGSYHLIEWMCTFAYLDAMCFDTPIFDVKAFDGMARVSNSFNIGDRLRRTEQFRSYLTAQWHSSRINVPYFDWTAFESAGRDSFKRVDAAITKIQQRAEGKSRINRQGRGGRHRRGKR